MLYQLIVAIGSAARPFAGGLRIGMAPRRSDLCVRRLEGMRWDGDRSRHTGSRCALDAPAITISCNNVKKEFIKNFYANYRITYDNII